MTLRLVLAAIMLALIPASLVAPATSAHAAKESEWPKVAGTPLLCGSWFRKDHCAAYERYKRLDKALRTPSQRAGGIQTLMLQFETGVVGGKSAGYLAQQANRYPTRSCGATVLRQMLWANHDLWKMNSTAYKSKQWAVPLLNSAPTPNSPLINRAGKAAYKIVAAKRGKAAGKLAQKQVVGLDTNSYAAVLVAGIGVAKESGLQKIFANRIGSVSVLCP